MTPRLRIHCLWCDTLLTVARPGDTAPELRNRCRWEQVDPPDAPEERWKWWCPNPKCRRTRELRSKRIGDTLDEMARHGTTTADI
jgi:hypothetical protein